MKREKYPDPMHPKAQHNYAFDFSAQLDALSDTLTGAPTVSVVGDTPPGFTISGVGLANSNKNVQYNVDISDAEEENAAYAKGGVTVCLECECGTVAGDTVVQQATLVIHDPCL